MAVAIILKCSCFDFSRYTNSIYAYLALSLRKKPEKKQQYYYDRLNCIVNFNRDDSLPQWLLTLRTPGLTGDDLVR